MSRENKAPSLLQDMLFLFMKLGIICLVFAVLFTFVYGAYSCRDNYMNPAITDGDFVIYYRLDKNYVVGDAVALKYEGKMITLRVVAEEGDRVDISEDGLLVNGALQQEQDIYQDTERFEEGIDFPITIQEGEVFLLGDAREDATDSRIIGPVKIDDTYGKVMMIIRRRGI